jgi:DNA replication protein DnaC
MTQNKSHLLLAHYLKQLKLPTILREYAAVVTTCTQDRCDYVSFLLRLVEREALDREQRAAERRVKNAHFPLLKTLDTFDFTAQPSLSEKLIRELMGGEYVERHENVLLVGNSGTGKTHLASALGFAGCTQGRRVRFFTVKALVTHLLEMTEQRQVERTLRQLERQDILILDELGYVPFSKTGAELLFEVVSRAYERLSLIVTTNLPFESWTEVFGSERLTGALLDRLTHRVHILEANGPSYRLRESKTRLQSGSPQPAESAPPDPEKPRPEDVSEK